MNAIILAAGIGTRLLPFTRNTPKPLTDINGVTIIERQIIFLKEAGVKDIYIIVGYKAELFQFLSDKYNVRLVFNRKFDQYNNIYSLSLCSEMLKNTWIIEGDVFLINNFINVGIKQSTYFPIFKSNLTGEWILEFQENKKLTQIITPNESSFHSKSKEGAYVMSGISFWDESSTNIIKNGLRNFLQIIESEVNSPVTNYYWDQIIKNNLNKLNIVVNKLDNGDCYEIDSCRDLGMFLDTIITR